MHALYTCTGSMLLLTNVISFYHFISTFIPSGLLSKPIQRVLVFLSQVVFTSFTVSPLLLVTIVCFGSAGRSTRMLLRVFTGLLATKEYSLSCTDSLYILDAEASTCGCFLLSTRCRSNRSDCSPGFTHFSFNTGSCGSNRSITGP